MNETCFLLGFMGSGKTYWGRRVSERLKMPFVDLDEVIEAGAQQSISAIFSQVGEDGFRQLEQNALRQLALDPPKVVATGGGTPCFFDNMAWMNTHGITVFLQVPVPVLAARLHAEQTIRPLLQGIPVGDLETHIARLLAQRAPMYQQARIVAAYAEDNDSFLEALLQQILGQKKPVK